MVYSLASILIEQFFERIILSEQIAIPRVSVVMSVYNETARLRRAIDSLLRQTWNDFELIVVDDGSQGETPSILSEYAQKDSRIRVIRQENAGLTMALIRGCNEARGEFIARHDADDWSEPSRLSEQANLLILNPNIGFVSCATQYVGPHEELLDLVRRDDPPPEATRKLLDERQGPPAHGSVMFRRSLYHAAGGYRSAFYFGQDSDLWMRMGELAPLMYDVRPLYFARRDPSGLSGQMSTRQALFGQFGQDCRAARRNGQPERQILKSAEELAEELRRKKKQSATSWGRATMAYLIGVSLAKRGDPRAQDYFWEAIRTNPLYWRAWMRLVLKPSPKADVTIEAATPE